MKWNTSFAAEIHKRTTYLQNLKRVYHKLGKKCDCCDDCCRCALDGVEFGKRFPRYAMYPEAVASLCCTREDMQQMVYAEIQRIEKWFKDNDVDFDEGSAT